MGPSGIEGFKPYRAYSSNPSDYYAGFSPLQQQAQSSAANLQTPSQFGQGSAMTGMAGMGALGTTGQANMYGNLGAQQGLGFAQKAQDPNAVQGYMNPYLQNALQPQLAEIQRQYDITGQQQAGQATQAGAFGGGRDAIMAAENARNKNTAMNQAIGQGYNTAFNNAQGQMATAAQLGMQGAQTGLQGVGAQQAGYGQAGQAGAGLASIGGQQLAAQQGIIGTQNQLGGQQQAAEQSKINQAVQDYATAQQYPMMQLGMMSNMLRGLPMQSTAVQSYQAQAPVAQQAAGLLGAYNAYTGKKEGGAIKAMAKGGIADVIPGYKSGVLARIDNTLEDISQADTYAQPSEKQLPKLMQQTQSPGIKQLIATKQAEDQLGQNMSGVAAGNTGDLGMNMAEGGIIPRFAGNTNGSKVEDPMSLDAMTKQVMKGYATPEEALQTQQGLRNTALQNLQGNLSPEELEQQKYIQENRAGLSDRQRRAERMNEALAWLEAGSTPGGLGTAAIAGGKKYMLGQGEIQNKYDEMKDNLVKQAADIKRAQRQEASGNATAAEASREKAQTHAFKAAELKAQIASSEKIAAGNNAATLGAAATNAAAHNSTRMYEQNMIEAYAKENGITPAAAYAQLVKGATNKQEKLELDRAKIQLEATSKADAVLNDNLAYVNLLTSKKLEDIEKAKIMRNNLIKEYITAGTPKVQNQNPPASNKDKGEVDTKNKLLNP
jgi:hypothetical protein